MYWRICWSRVYHAVHLQVVKANLAADVLRRVHCAMSKGHSLVYVLCFSNFGGTL